MKNVKSLIMIIIGAMLLLAALSLVLYNVNEDKKSGKAAQAILDELKAEMTPPETQSTEEHTFTAQNDIYDEYEQKTEPSTAPEEALVELDGRYYIGTISAPALEVELPVMSEWSYPNLKLSPCRYKGTVAGGDLIIAAHNYRSHFGRINDLHSGELLIFTDAYGTAHEYQIIQTEMIAGRDIEAMDFGSATDWDLTLFTCTLSGQSRVTVRAVKVEK